MAEALRTGDRMVPSDGDVMNVRSRRIAAALVVGLIVALALTGCASGSSLNEAEVAAGIEAAVVKTVPGADGAYVGFATDGSPTRHTLFVRVYFTSVEASSLGAVADATLKIAWEQMPSEPSSVGFQAFDGQMPTEPKRVSLDNIDLGNVEENLGTGSVGLDGQMFEMSATEMAARYGDWKKPAKE
jgi:hypothetical protein